MPSTTGSILYRNTNTLTIGTVSGGTCVTASQTGVTAAGANSNIELTADELLQDAGTIKASQAVSTGVIQPNKSPNLAVIDKIQLNAPASSQAEDRSLADMGYTSALIQRRGVNYSTYTFNIPSGFSLATGAYFDLVYGNSALLDFNRSGIVIQLNNRPIGSVKFSDATSGTPTNKSHILIPSAAILPGKNVLQIITNLVPTDDCTPPGLNQGMWVNIWAESFLHLPLATTSVNSPVSAQINLSTFLPTFINDPMLNDTAFVLPVKNPEAWRSAFQLAAYLGSAANGPITTLTAFYGDAVPEADRQKYNFLVIGRPSEMQFLKDLKKELPVPFLENSDTPSTNNSRVIYRIPPEVPLGYVEIMQSSWNPNNVVLSVLGNSTQGVGWAASSLIDANLSWRLAGNFAVVNDLQVLTTDTSMLAVGSTSIATPPPGESIVIPNISTEIPKQAISPQPDWIIPTLIVSVSLI
ncbi:MAG: cellulose biosynthesis cyclic di-GMP-binding regulatory protein BcsB, partial [Leptolinea sp.]